MTAFEISRMWLNFSQTFSKLSKSFEVFILASLRILKIKVFILPSFRIFKSQGIYSGFFEDFKR